MDTITGHHSIPCSSILRVSIAIILLISLIVPLQSSQALPSSTFTVNTDSDYHDTNPGDNLCKTNPFTNECSLRAAVEEVNALNSGVINFTGNFTISLENQLEVHPDNVTISGNGRTVKIIGPSTSGSIALWLGGNGGYVDHLTITNPNGYGIYIADSPTSNGRDYIIDNVTFLNSYNGVRITGSTNEAKGRENTIQNSRFGTTLASPTGCGLSEGNQYGIYLSNYARLTSILNNQIVCSTGNGIHDANGIGTTISGNTIAGNGGHGVYMNGTNPATITGNFIGNQSGVTRFENAQYGTNWKAIPPM